MEQQWWCAVEEVYVLKARDRDVGDFDMTHTIRNITRIIVSMRSRSDRATC